MTQRAPGRPRSTQADVAILDAALDLLIERGVSETSIEQVAQRAGVTRATIYRRFPDRVQLLVAAVERAYGNPPAIPVIDDLEHLLDGWAHVLSQPRQRRLVRRLYSSTDDYPELGRTFENSLQGPRDEARRDVLRRAREAGQLPPDADVHVILQILTGAVWHHLAAYPDTTPEREVRRYLTAVLRQVGYRPEAG